LRKLSVAPGTALHIDAYWLQNAAALLAVPQGTVGNSSDEAL
jgi:hypothetical protein